tara:strand:+ start:400 stop:675 length:276 start_codon:yes stop_codon:yes gene_type:complete
MYKEYRYQILNMTREKKKGYTYQYFDGEDHLKPSDNLLKLYENIDNVFWEHTLDMRTLSLLIVEIIDNAELINEISKIVITEDYAKKGDRK